MPDYDWFDPKNIGFRQTVKTCISVNQERRNLGYDKAGMAHETSPKSSVSEFLDGLVSFPVSPIFISVKDRFDPCPLCNAFSHIYQVLISSGGFDISNQNHLKREEQREEQKKIKTEFVF